MFFLPKQTSGNADALSKEMIANQLPLVDISGNVMIFRDGSLSAGFTCHAPVTGLLPDDERGSVFESLRAALRLLPQDANLQVSFGQESRASDIAEILRSDEILNPVVKLAVDGRTATQVAALERGELRVTTLDVYLSIPSVVSKKELGRRVKLLEKSVSKRSRGQSLGQKANWWDGILAPITDTIDSVFTPLKGAVVLTYEEYQDTREKLLIAAETLQSSLRQANLSPRPMTSDDLLKRLYRKWNPSKYEAGLLPRPYASGNEFPVAEHFLQSPFDWDPAGKRVPKGMFYLDGYYHQVVTMTMPPETLFFPHLENNVLYGGLQRMEVIVNIIPSSVEERIKQLQEEETAIHNNKKADTSAQKLQLIKNEMAELGNGEERLWQAQHLYVLRHRNPDSLKKEVSALLSSGQRDGGMDMSEEVHALFSYWLASQPGYARDTDLHRHNKFNTRQLVAMLPTFGGSRIDPDKKVGAVFETNDGSLHNVFLHDSQEMPSPNALVLGVSGSGKSVLVNTIITQLSRHNPRVVLVDIGSSYRKLCESLGGTFMEYDIRTNDCCINLFDIYTKGTAEPDEIQRTLLLLEKMVYDPRNRPELNNVERTILEDSLQTLIRKADGKEFFLSNLREFLISQDTPVATDLAMALGPYCRNGGSYANLFDGPTNAPMGNRFTVFELQKVKHSSPELLPIVFQVVLQHTVSLATNYPDDLRILGMDEAHVLLENPALRKFVELAYRTFRKQGVAVLGISQGIDDWIVPGKERAILDNVSGLFICAQKSAGADRIGQMYELSENEVAAIKSLRIEPGVVSEFLTVTFGSKGRKATVCANKLSAAEYAMYTTSPEDTRLMNKWRSAGETLAACIDRFSKKYPRGVERGEAIPDSNGEAA